MFAAVPAQPVSPPPAQVPQPSTGVGAPSRANAQAPSALPPLGPNLTEDIEPAELTFDHFELIIYNQVGVVFNDKVKALASANSVGPFSVLPGHTNFISMITAPVTAYLMNGQTRSFEAGLGVLRCYHNRVEVFAGLHVSKEAENLAKRLQSSGREVIQGEEVVPTTQEAENEAAGASLPAQSVPSEATAGPASLPPSS